MIWMLEEGAMNILVVKTILPLLLLAWPSAGECADAVPSSCLGGVSGEWCCQGICVHLFSALLGV